MGRPFITTNIAGDVNPITDHPTEGEAPTPVFYDVDAYPLPAGPPVLIGPGTRWQIPTIDEKMVPLVGWRWIGGLWTVTIGMTPRLTRVIDVDHPVLDLAPASPFDITFNDLFDGVPTGTDRTDGHFPYQIQRDFLTPDFLMFTYHDSVSSGGVTEGYIRWACSMSVSRYAFFTVGASATGGPSDTPGVRRFWCGVSFVATPIQVIEGPEIGRVAGAWPPDDADQPQTAAGITSLFDVAVAATTVPGEWLIVDSIESYSMRPVPLIAVDGGIPTCTTSVSSSLVIDKYDDLPADFPD